MAEYSQFNRPSLLVEGDLITFEVPREIYRYVVANCCICLCRSPGSGESYFNNTIFRVLGLNANEVCTQMYGYPNEGGDWPQFRRRDYRAATRVVNHLFDVIAFGYDLVGDAKLPVKNLVREELHQVLISLTDGKATTFNPENKKLVNFLIRRGLIEKKTFRILDENMLKALRWKLEQRAIFTESL